ncbi:MAG: TRAP transporter large permease subunit, partial [Bilophila sp.]
MLGSALTGVVSGSSIANVVTTAFFAIPLMKKVGYPAHKAAAVEVASSINGQLAPPVMGAAAPWFSRNTSTSKKRGGEGGGNPGLRSLCGPFEDHARRSLQARSARPVPRGTAFFLENHAGKDCISSSPSG